MFDWVRALFNRSSRTLRDDEISSTTALPATMGAGVHHDDTSRDDSSGSDYGGGADSGGSGSGGGSDSGGGGGGGS